MAGITRVGLTWLFLDGSLGLVSACLLGALLLSESKAAQQSGLSLQARVDSLELAGGYNSAVDLGDLDGDGFPEVAARGAAKTWGVPYRWYVFSTPGWTLTSRFISWTRIGDRQAVSMGRVTGGPPLLLIGDPGANPIGGECGEVMICDPVRNQVVHRVPTPTGLCGFGGSVVSGRDLTGDGLEDLVATSGSYAGSVSLIDSSTLKEVWRFPGVGSEGIWGPCAFLEDLTGDGVPEVAVGSQYYNGFDGRAMVLSGSDGTLLWERHGSKNAGRAQLGRWLGVTDDLDGDGIPDLAFTDDSADGVRLYVHRGSDLSEIAVHHWPSVLTAFYLESIADRNSDGIRDYVFLGGNMWTRKDALFFVSPVDGAILEEREPMVTNGFRPYSYSEVSDLTGDGIPDYLYTTIGSHGRLNVLETNSLYLHHSPGPLADEYGSLELEIRFPSLPGATFALLASTSVDERLPFGERSLPLCFTPLLVQTVASPQFGTLDALGSAVIPITLPPGAQDGGTSGAEFHVCALGLDPSAPYGVRAISNAVEVFGQ